MAKTDVPWIPFYTGDWMSDVALRSCSLAARGLWMDLLCIMHESQRRGYLLLGGVPATVKALSRIAGEPEESLASLLTELRSAGVFSEEDDLIFSRRMVKDEHIRTVRRAAGRKGGNPVLLIHQDKQPMTLTSDIDPIPDKPSPRKKKKARRQQDDQKAKRYEQARETVDAVLTATNEARVAKGQKPLNTSARANWEPVLDRLEEGYTVIELCAAIRFVIVRDYMKPEYWHPENMLRVTKLPGHIERARGAGMLAQPQEAEADPVDAMKARLAARAGKEGM